jgi:hypothetical protein
MGVAYHRYADAVVENDIDGQMLGGLTEEHLGEVGVTSSLHKRKLLKVIGDWVARNETIFTSVASMSVSPEVRRLFPIIHQHSSMCDAVPSAGVCGAVSCTSPACAVHARAQRGRGARGSSCFVCYTHLPLYTLAPLQYSIV